MSKIEKRFADLEKRVKWLEGDESDEISWTKINNLEWSSDLGEKPWGKAVETCEKLGGRLPTRVELFDLYDNHYDECQELIKDSPSNDFCTNVFWSSTEGSVTPAWNVDLNAGYTYNSPKTVSTRLRCVR